MRVLFEPFSIRSSEGIRHNKSTFNWSRLTWPAWALRHDPSPLLAVHSGDGAGKIARLESFEVVRALADPDEVNRKLKLFRDKHGSVNTVKKSGLITTIATTPCYLQAAINRFVEETNSNPKPFVRTADPKRVLAAVKRGKQKLESIH